MRNTEDKGRAPVHHLMPLVGGFRGLEHLNAGAANIRNIATSLAFLSGYDGILTGVKYLKEAA